MIIFGLMVKIVCPYVWESFEEHTLYGVKLSRAELKTLESIFTKAASNDDDKKIEALAKKLPFIKRG